MKPKVPSDEPVFVSPNYRVTDFKGGRILDDATGRSVPATAISRAILFHFARGLAWEDFEKSHEAQEAFEAMKKVGLLRRGSGTDALFDLIPADIGMFDAPHRDLADIAAGDIVFLGAPIDIGTTALPGARFGPAAIRAASVERYLCDYDLASGTLKGWNVPNLGGLVLSGARLVDLGDLKYLPGSAADSYYEKLRRVVDQIYARQAFPVVLGGDHSITYGTVHRDADVLLHLDAHSDMAAFDKDTCHHHGNVLTRLIAEKMLSQVVHLGLRDTAGSDTAEAGSVAFSADPNAFPSVLKHIEDKSVFISLDVDVMDPAVLPGTGTPLPGGLSVRELCNLLCQVVMGSKPLGIDVVELCPLRDADNLSAATVVEIILVFLAMYHKHHGRSPQ